MEENKTLFYHGKTIDNYRFTIAGQFSPLPKGEDKDIDVILLGASLCSPEDQFVKKLGRKKAEGRMNSTASIKGRNYYSLYGEPKASRWFEGQEINVFLETVKLNEILTRKGFMNKFNL